MPIAIVCLVSVAEHHPKPTACKFATVGMTASDGLNWRTIDSKTQVVAGTRSSRTDWSDPPILTKSIAPINLQQGCRYVRDPRKFCQVNDRFQFGLPKGVGKIGLAYSSWGDRSWLLSIIPVKCHDLKANLRRPAIVSTVAVATRSICSTVLLCPIPNRSAA